MSLELINNTNLKSTNKLVGAQILNQRPTAVGINNIRHCFAAAKSSLSLCLSLARSTQTSLQTICNCECKQ